VLASEMNVYKVNVGFAVQSNLEELRLQSSAKR